MDQSKPPVVVAVVEDDAPSRTALGRLLRQRDSSRSSSNRRKPTSRPQPRPRVIIVDVQLPGMSGIELQQRLRAAGPAPPIIMTTSRHDTRHTGARATERVRRVFLEAGRRPHPDGHHRVARESLAEWRLVLSTRPRVLLADDYPEMVKAVGRLLALDCEVVGSVADGSALLEAAQRLAPDVIVLDLNLPNVNGLEACRQITRVNPAMKVIMFTALTIRTSARRSSRPAHLPSYRNWCPSTCCRRSSACASTEADDDLVRRRPGLRRCGPAPSPFRGGA